ncbi:MAG: CapA family protein [Oscillospiraceae bacterium]|nr:CapA family protein [Oscillospiraceae bacterium]
MKTTKFIAAGDAFITRRFPEGGYEGFQELKTLIEAHDVRFLNLESTFHNCEGYPAAESGGTWAMSDPRMLDDLRSYGFNIFTTANNHSGDFGEGGVLATIRHLKERDMVFSGTGENLGEASKPCYLETRQGRVALISCNAGNRKAPGAGDQSRNMPGRPGLNPVGIQEVYHLDPEHFAMVQELAKVSTVNREMEKSIRNGYSVAFPEDVLPLGGTRFKLDDRCFVESMPAEKDMRRIEAEIREAKLQADTVLVSIHSHYIDSYDNTKAPQFLEIFCHRCIDAGASVVIGHGPHELQGVELYKDGLILYSIGNFLFETDTVEFQPWDAYHNRGMDVVNTKVGAYMLDRSKNGTVGYAVQWPIWNSLLFGWTMEDGKLTQVQLYPIELGMDKPRSQKGVPVLNGSEKTLRYLEEISAKYGTKIRIQDGIGYIDF